MLRFLARFLAVVLAAAFVVSAVVAIFLRPIGTRLLAPETYRQITRERRLAERFPALATDLVHKALQAARADLKREKETADFAEFLGGFSPEGMQTLIGAALPADYVQAQLDGAVDQFLGYMNSSAPRPELKLSLVEFKRRLVGGVLEDAYVKLLQTLPSGVEATRGLPVASCPPAERLPEVRTLFREMIGPAVAEIPDSVDLFADEANTYSIYGTLAHFRSRLQTLGMVARWCWVVPVALLLGVALFAVRSLRGALLWLGLPCVIAGAAAVVFALPGAAMGDWVFQLLVKPQLPAEVPVLAVEAVLGLVTALAQVVFGAAMKAALWLLLGGVAAVVLACFLKSKPAVAR